MKDSELKIGSVVLSKKGRDCGYFFVVVGFDEENVLIADGHKHMLCKPKKKNIKHIAGIGEILVNIAEKLKTNKKVFDSEINSALRPFQSKDREGIEGVKEKACPKTM